MSMLTMQIDKLRKAARNIQGNLGRCCYRRKDVNEMQQVSDMLREAANTIESLRDRLQAAELGSGTCENEWAQFGKLRCSECWLQVDSISTNTTAPIPIKHCPNCGAKVVKR